MNRNFLRVLRVKRPFFAVSPILFIFRISWRDLVKNGKKGPFYPQHPQMAKYTQLPDTTTRHPEHPMNRATIALEIGITERQVRRIERRALIKIDYRLLPDWKKMLPVHSLLLIN